MLPKKDLRQKVQDAADCLGFSAHAVALSVNLGYSTVGRFLAGDLKESAGIRRELTLFLDQVRRGEIRSSRQNKVTPINARTPGRRPPKHPERRRRTFETTTMKRVWSTIDLAAENSSLALITADFGAGKTHAAQAWRSKSDLNSIYFEFDDFSAASKIEFIDALASQLGIGGAVNMHSASRIFREVVSSLREEPAVLIFDQCEMVRFRVLQLIRQLWDRTNQSGVAVVLLSAPQLLRRLERGRSTDLGALRSRIGVWVHLRGVERDEMAAIIKSEGLTVNDAAFELWYRAVGGSMRWLMESIDLLVARHKGKSIGERTIAGVCGRLMGIKIPSTRPPPPNDTRGPGARTTEAAEA